MKAAAEIVGFALVVVAALRLSVTLALFVAGVGLIIVANLPEQPTPKD